MSDAKALDQNPSVGPTTMGSQVPVQPTGSMHKEQIPVGGGSSDFLKPSGTDIEHKIDKELRDIGVQEKKDRPYLTDEHRKIGIDHAGASIPPQTTPTGLFRLPLTRNEALAEVKRKKPTDSGWGFGELVLKVLKAMGIVGV